MLSAYVREQADWEHFLPPALLHIEQQSTHAREFLCFKLCLVYHHILHNSLKVFMNQLRTMASCIDY